MQNSTPEREALHIDGGDFADVRVTIGGLVYFDQSLPEEGVSGGLTVLPHSSALALADGLRAALATPPASKIPPGMKPWQGGDSAPADWDGGTVLRRNGTFTGATRLSDWSNTEDDCPNPLPDDIIAYTPASTSEVGPAMEQVMRAAAFSGTEHRYDVEPVASTSEREEIARIIDPDAWHDNLPEDGLGVWWITRRNKAREQADRILALRPSPAPALPAEKRICTVCTATVSTYPQGMCCHCQELPWPLAALKDSDHDLI